jgi:hypothetical protein
LFTRIDPPEDLSVKNGDQPIYHNSVQKETNYPLEQSKKFIDALGHMLRIGTVDDLSCRLYFGRYL